MWLKIQEWAGNPWVWATLMGVSLLTLVVSALGVPCVVRQLPVDHFVADKRPPQPRGLAQVLVRNLLGWILLLAGILMCFVPGQGLLTILIGLTLTDFPGKRSMECALFRRVAPLRTGLQWIRKRADVPPFEEMSHSENFPHS